MSFTYDVNTYLGQVRFLVADTDSTNPIFDDDELNMCLQFESSQGLYISGQAAVSAIAASNPPIPQVYSVYRAAAMALDSLAANKSRLSSVTQLLDVQLDVKSAATALKDQAENYRQIEARRGSFAIAELVFNDFTARERVFKQWQRQYGS